MFCFSSFFVSGLSWFRKKAKSRSVSSVVSYSEKTPQSNRVVRKSSSMDTIEGHEAIWEETGMTSRAWRRRAGIWSLDSVAIDTSLCLISIFDEDESLAGWNDGPSSPIPTMSTIRESDLSEDNLTIITLLLSGSQRNHRNKPGFLIETCSDVERACQYHREYLWPLGLSLIGFLEALANAFRLHFEESGEVIHLESSLNFIYAAKERLSEQDHDSVIRALARLWHLEGLIRSSRFERCYHSSENEDMSDIDNAILSWEWAVNLTPDDQSEKVTYLSNLGQSYQVRFEQLGVIADLDGAISAQREATQLMEDGHSGILKLLNVLATSLETRFERQGLTQDINEAVTLRQLAIQLMH